MGAPLKGDVHFELDGEGFSGFSIVVPSLLRRIERDILGHPDRVGVHAISFVNARTLADVPVELKEALALGSGPEVDAFLAARKAVFEGIYQHHFKREPGENDDAGKRAGLVETVDLGPLAEQIERYATTFVALGEAAKSAAGSEQRAARVKALAELDVVEMRWHRGPGDPGRALLIAPTHPLRLLWHLRHMQACAHAVTAWEDGTRQTPNWRELMDQLREGLLPMNLPMVLFDRQRRGYVEHTPSPAFGPCISRIGPMVTFHLMPWQPVIGSSTTWESAIATSL